MRGPAARRPLPCNQRAIRSLPTPRSPQGTTGASAPTAAINKARSDIIEELSPQKAGSVANNGQEAADVAGVANEGMTPNEAGVMPTRPVALAASCRYVDRPRCVFSRRRRPQCVF